MHVIDLFIKLLSFESITPDDAGSLAFIEEYLEGYEATYLNEGGVKNLFLTKEFGAGEHLCFAGHVDVVPPGEGWHTPPFVPMVEEGVITARGTQDMKSGVAAFVQALKETKEFNGRLSLLLTSDEEGEATHGTVIMLEYLKKVGLLPDFCVVAEPTCEEVFGDAIKVGRRGSINGYLTLNGKQGHAAYPEKTVNPVHNIAPLLAKFAGLNLDEGDENFSPSKLVVTDIRAGLQVTNVTPGKLELMFNVRNSTKRKQEDIKALITQLFEGLDFELKLKQGSYPFITSRDSKVVENLVQSIDDVLGVKTKYSTAGGTSDARFMAQYGIEVVEFGVKNDTIHAPNERTTVAEVEGLCAVFQQLIGKF